MNRRIVVLTVGLLLLTTLGCGVPRSRVHGVVRFQGKPLTAGTVALVASDNQTHLADIGKDGSYSVSGVARGEVRVSIQVPYVRVAPKAEPGKGPEGGELAKDDTIRKDGSLTGLSIPLPERYQDANTSGLQFSLKEPDQEYNIDLK